MVHPQWGSVRRSRLSSLRCSWVGGRDSVVASGCAAARYRLGGDGGALDRPCRLAADRHSTRGNGPRIDLGIRLTWSDVGWGVTAGVVGLILAGIVAVITQAIAGDFSSAAGEIAVELREAGPFWALLIFAIMVMVGAPIVEELAFRGMLYNSLRKRGVGAVWTIAITTVAFSAFHFEPVRFFLLLPIGVVYGWVRWKTGSLGASMVAHGVNNTPAALVVLLGVPEMTP